MVCNRCQKRPAIIFVQRMENGQMKNEGFCLHCARELHIKPVEDLMKQFGMSDEDMDNMENRMESMMDEMGDANPLSLMMNMGQPMDGEENEGDDDLVPGSSATFPLGVKAEGDAGNSKKAQKNGKKPPRRKFLDTYCENLTRKAREGKLDDIVGRDREIYRTIQILSRRQKNNPCLIGEAGVGKTAIAEGIAERIARGNVPVGLKDKEIFLLDLTSLVAGTQFRGQFEQRVKGLLSEVKAAGNIILFIDEIHTITSAGESEGAMNAGNILKPALSRGEIQVIGATTFNEYRKYIEKDQALERRFQPVRVEEPSVADTLAVMNGIKKYYEEHHHVQVDADVLSAIVTLSERYITDRYLPDKAIDLLDEACACCNLAHPVISEYLEMQKELDGLRQEEADMESSDVNEAIDYEQVAQRKTRIAKLEAELPAKQAAASEIKVTMDDVAKVIELWTGIPAVKIQETEFVKLAGLEAELKKKIIGQDEAVHLVAQAVKRSRADLSGRRRPASFIFVAHMAQLAVQGPKAIQALQKLTSINLSDLPYYTFTHGEFAGEKDVIISNTGYTGAGGFELYFYPEAAMKIWDAVFEAGAEFGIKPVGLGARDTLRLEMGFCLYGNDLDDTTSPIEAGLGWITKFVEGKNFTNRPMLEKQKAEGTTRKLVGFEMIDRGIPRHGYELYSTDGTAIGVVTSGTMSPTRKIGIGMGYIRPEYSKVGTEICIDMRGRKLKAVVVKPPFRKQ